MNYSRLKEIVEKCGLQKKELCTRAGITPQALHTILGGGDIKVSTLESLSKAMGISIAYLFSDEEVKVEIRGGRNVFLNSGNIRDQAENLNGGNSDQIETMKKTIAAQEKTISTQQMLIDLLTKK